MKTNRRTFLKSFTLNALPSIVLVLLFLFTLPVHAAWYNSSWSYRIKLTVDASKVNGDLANFPVFVDLNGMPAAFFDNVAANGADLRVTKADGSTEIAREIVSVDKVANGGELHFVANGTLSSSSNTDFYIYYGNAGASEPAASSTYGSEKVWTEGFVGVWHLGENGNTIDNGYADSSVNANHANGVSMTAASDVAGKLGKAQDLDGSADSINFGSTATLDSINSSFTINYWQKLDSLTNRCWLNKYNGDGVTFGRYNGNWEIYVYGDTNSVTQVADSELSTSAWQYISLAYSSDTFVRAYINGALKTENTSASVPNTLAGQETADFNIATDAGGFGGVLDGQIDELRVSNLARSANWISAEYNNQNSPSTFYTIGTEESDLSDWTYKHKITIKSSLINGDLSNFPVYLNLEDFPLQFHNNVKSDGSDIRITTADQGTELAFEVVSVDNGNQTGELWFKADSISSSTNTDFWIFYGNAAASAYAANHNHGSEDVWSQGFVAVYHMNEDPTGTIFDSTSNDNDGTTAGAMTSGDLVAGQTGKAIDFDGAGDLVNFGNGSSINFGNSGAYSVELWMNSNIGSPSGDQLIGKDAGGNKRIHFYLSSGLLYRWDAFSGPAIGTAGVWKAISYTYEPTASNVGNEIFYTDGSSSHTRSGAMPPWSSTDNWTIGGNSGTYSGLVDELRISNVTRSANWISAAHNNQSDSDNFYLIDGLAIVEPVITSLSPPDNATNALQDANLVINFNTTVVTQTGNLNIMQLNGSLFEAIDISSAQVTGSGTSTLTINPSLNLVNYNDYYINIDINAIRSSSKAFSGIADTTTWNFMANEGSLSAWKHSDKITIQASQVNGDLTDFPVYIDLSHMSSRFFNTVDSNGADIRVTNGDRLTQIPFELVNIDTANGTGELWLKATSLSSSSNSDFYLWYNNPSAGAYPENSALGAQAVWSNDFVVVYHMNEDPTGTIYDSTSFNNDGTTGGAMTSGDLVTGEVGTAIDFDGSGDNINFGNDASVNFGASGSYSVEFWANSNIVNPSGDQIIGKNAGGDKRIHFYLSGGTIYRWSTFSGPSLATASQWKSISYNYDATNGEIFYTDGISTHTRSGAMPAWSSTGDWYISGSAGTFNGLMDEVRISNNVRSANWVSTSYNNQNGTSSFYTVEEVPDIGGVFNWNLF